MDFQAKSAFGLTFGPVSMSFVAAHSILAQVAEGRRRDKTLCLSQSRTRGAGQVKPFRNPANDGFDFDASHRKRSGSRREQVASTVRSFL
jgi:hypothetical protein